MKALKYTVGIVAVILIAYNAVYFKKMDEVKASKNASVFNADQFAESFWTTKLIPGLSNAVDITKLTSMLSTDPQGTFDAYSHALGIGNLRYFLVKGTGTISSVNADDITVLADSSTQTIKLITEYVFGNAVRDATGLISINEFNNTMDFNNVSAEINRIIREKVIPPFKIQAKKGDRITFTGAIEINKEHPDLSNIEIIPVEIKTI